ncbi:undecaprenyl-phosphate galactosephosphotransferase [Actinobacillus equuli]|nr:undecaprenyl-phosphate galactosephosphotransferase [Actinobacillus equuli]
MSLVGPRPIVADELARYEEDVDYYLMAKPGMTGLWQVSGRNDVDYETRVYFDSWYVKTGHYGTILRFFLKQLLRCVSEQEHIRS